MQRINYILFLKEVSFRSFGINLARFIINVRTSKISSARRCKMGSKGQNKSTEV